MKLSEQLREYALLGDGEWLLQRAKEVARLEAENDVLRIGPHVYQMPQGDWAWAYMGTISDGYESKLDALEAAIESVVSHNTQEVE